MLRRLAPADYATLIGLGLGWTAVSLFLQGRPDAATLTLLLAFLCDKADGCLARLGYGSPLGHQLDALADVVIYLVPTAIVLSDLLAGPPVLESLAGTVVVGFGILRLARYSVDGAVTADEPPYYQGITAFHVAAWALVVRLAVALIAIPSLIGAVSIVIITPLMIAPFRIYATRNQFIGAVIIGSIITTGALV
ncbi:CDP-alcohol phosphatidyltransferase family protein [Halosolutus halophilus]|uniref:CDP-alcohol phosphatidyltransferase family protein n=1 Tax=Halosolutus halophilus TaxID=1552990 RepID=UPI0022351318|nr:CDP-alcohol phosphatidyltransferase family protein [Halosolutus halophilus]